MACDTASTVITPFWQPGMPAKSFDEFDVKLVKENLKGGFSTVFPSDLNAEYLIENFRQKTIHECGQDFICEPITKVPNNCNPIYLHTEKYSFRGMNLPNYNIMSMIDVYQDDDCQIDTNKSHDKPFFYMHGTCYLRISIVIGVYSGFSNYGFKKYSFKLTPIDMCM